MVRLALFGVCAVFLIAEAAAQTGRGRQAAAGSPSRTDRIAAGDTRFTLAWRHGVSWERIARANGLDPDAPLRIGALLRIPAPGAALAPSAAARPPRFAWPLAGALQRGYRASSPGGHDGLDIAAPAGTPVRAAAGGQVIFAGEEPRQFGQLVVVDHGQGWHSAYGFLSRIAVREGDRVRAGGRLGWVGDTGLARGDELHFELRRDNRPVDPLPLLEPAR